MIPNFIVNLVFLVFGTWRSGYLTYLRFTTQGVKGCSNWIKYWIVYAILVGVFSITDIILFWLPFYEEVKLASMVWLFISPPSGSAAFFDSIIFPLMVRNEKTLEILINDDQMYVHLRNVMREVYAWMERCILPHVINTIRDQLYPVLISEVSSALLKSHHNEKNMTARVVEAETEEAEIEHSSFDEWEDAQLPEEVNDEATHFGNNPFLHGSEPINQGAKRNGNNNNNFMPITGKLDIYQFIQLVNPKKAIEDVKDEAIYEKVGQSNMC